MPGDDLFLKIIAGEIPSNKVYEDDLVYAFHDINPAAPTHVLIIPKERISSIDEANESHKELLGHLLLKANHVAELLGLTEDGFRYVINTKRDGGQTVYHLHLHILGGRSLSWPPG